MRKKITFLFLIFYSIIFIISLSSFENPVEIAKSDGGPPYNTNAPGEKTCSGDDTGNSCHSGGIKDNAGPGLAKISFSGGASYESGKTYTITASISHPDRVRFGFQIVSLRTNGNANAGKIVSFDTTRNRMQQPNYGSYQDRVYLMHIKNGTISDIHNGEWSYTWTAPNIDRGPITFYAAFVASNNNNVNDPDDQTYFTKLTVNPLTKSVFENNDLFSLFNIFPNPIQTNFYIKYNLEYFSFVKVVLLDINGKEIQTIQSKESVFGNIDDLIQIPFYINNGVYFLKISTSKDEYLHKIIISK